MFLGQQKNVARYVLSVQSGNKIKRGCHGDLSGILFIAYFDFFMYLDVLLCLTDATEIDHAKPLGRFVF